ncbi:uncharacterized protein LOC102701791 [Oryza brachyantha]|uniref:Survival Motor Neuron Gemin2-binding domain-containing protein n=1 Tax=Oryza brachyantha TaxID=4533 RepID=J3LG37_ORYBR|nr:uncharacterized protein LOC102701791 [Oryza brachyantha]
MGKGSELWDDSALVDAFDHAVATFKATHGKGTQATPSENEEPEDPSAAAPAGEEPILTEVATEPIEKDGSQTELPCEASETPCQTHEERKPTEQAPLQGTDLEKETHFSEPKMHASDATDAEQKDTSDQQTWDYNELVKKYYELEEQSRKVLEQLHQTNYWSYQVPGQSSVYQQVQVPAYSATAPDLHSSTIQNPYCCANVPLVSVSCCSTGQTSGASCMQPSGGCSISLTCDQCPGTSTAYSTGASCMQQPEKVSTDGDQVAKAAIMTAEGAMNFMRSTISGDSGTFPRVDTASGKEGTTMGMNPNFDTVGADSDLAVVLNAWYAAGFYTGRYLMQQSMKNSRQG